MSFKYTVVFDIFAFLGCDVLENSRDTLQTIKDAGFNAADLHGNPKKWMRTFCAPS